MIVIYYLTVILHCHDDTPHTNILIPFIFSVIFSIQGQCAIIMFDVTSRITYRSVPNWHRYATSFLTFVPIAISTLSNYPDFNLECVAAEYQLFDFFSLSTSAIIHHTNP